MIIIAESVAKENGSKIFLALNLEMEICFVQYARMHHHSLGELILLVIVVFLFKRESHLKHNNSKHHKDIRDSVVSAKKPKCTLKEKQWMMTT